MSHRGDHPLPRIVETVIKKKGGEWSPSSQETVRGDAEKILEALVAEVGVEATVQALDRQGFEGKAYRYLLTPLFEEAQRRRPSIDCR